MTFSSQIEKKIESKKIGKQSFSSKNLEKMSIFGAFLAQNCSFSFFSLKIRNRYQISYDYVS